MAGEWFSLRCGRRVRFEDFQFTRTYAGWLEGIPTSADNDKIIADASKALKWKWGSCRVVTLKTERVRVELSPSIPRNFVGENLERLPAIQCVAVLDSLPIDDAFCGSHAFLAWWQDESALDAPAKDQVIAALGERCWEDVASDYDI